MKSLRVLHVVKTSDGADWAAYQAGVLTKQGVEVHVALPSLQGRTVSKWREAGAILHEAPTDMKASRVCSSNASLRQFRTLVETVKPDLIHSHFVSSTLFIRRSLGAQSPIPRLFQVPGPLHMEHTFWRNLDLITAAPRDIWIASSRCIREHYLRAGIEDSRVFLSYYGTRTEECKSLRTGTLRKRFGIPAHIKIVGNANYIYPPKWYLGHWRGLKAHEDVIDALAKVIHRRRDVVGVLIGGDLLKPGWYERSLRKRAERAAPGRILMTGFLPMHEVRAMWADFDLAVHVPLSENCGGVVEPMLAGVPVIAGRVGGLPEIVVDGVTGTTVPVRRPEALATEIERVLDHLEDASVLAKRAQSLAAELFSVERTGREVIGIYKRVLNHPD